MGRMVIWEILCAFSDSFVEKQIGQEPTTSLDEPNNINQHLSQFLKLRDSNSLSTVIYEAI